MNKDLFKAAAIIALLWLFKEELTDFIWPVKKEPLSDPEIDDSVALEDDPCKQLIYKPFSPASPHGGDLLPKGTCYIGDSYWDDKPHETGDIYADEQAEEFQKDKQGDIDLDKLNSVTLILQNTTDEDIDQDIGDSTSNDTGVWPDPTPEPSNFSGWFLPSLDELQAMYDNLHVEGVGGFTDIGYWTSSEYNANAGYRIDFTNGSSLLPIKENLYHVRPARTFTASAGQYSLRDVGPGGGLIFYIDGTTYYEAAETDASDGYYWSNIDDVAIGTTGTAIGTGITNTADIIDQAGHITSAAYASSISQDEFTLLTADYAGTQINIVLTIPSGKSITVDWGDGNTETKAGTGAQLSFDSTYSANGNYDVTISGDIFYTYYIQVANEAVSGDISGWSALTALTQISSSSNNLSGDISGWSALTKLTNITCDNNDVSGDISSWSALTLLVAIKVNSTDVSGDISGWSVLVSLESVIANNTTVSGDVSSWSALELLETLYLYNTSVEGDISGWSTLTKLTNLWVYNTSISGDISSLTTLSVIQTMYLYNTNVEGDVSGFSVLTSLTLILLQNTAVSGDISSWSSLTNLTWIQIYNTAVSGDISTWRNMSSLSVEIRIHNTNVDFDSDTAWTDMDVRIWLADCGLTSTQVDNALIAFAGGSFVDRNIDLAGTNAARTSASDAALATLLAAGNTVDVNE